MKAKDSWVFTGKFTVTVEHYAKIPALGEEEYGFHVMTSRDEDGDIMRALGLPPIVIYRAYDDEKLYEGWPDPDGVMRARENEDASEIYYTEGNARMVWYDADGKIDRVVDIDPLDSLFNYGAAHFRHNWTVSPELRQYFDEFAKVSSKKRIPVATEIDTQSPSHLLLHL